MFGVGSSWQAGNEFAAEETGEQSVNNRHAYAKH
jgi:hypothetical protein